MREPSETMEKYRVAGTPELGNNGAFLVPFVGTHRLRVIVSDGMGWDHVSVSLDHRCPTWEEMAFIKRFFFRDEEAVMQLHPPKQEHVNNHPYCLHLWRPQHTKIPLPPAAMVGIKGMDPHEIRRLLGV